MLFTLFIYFQEFPPALNAMGFYEVNMKQNFSGGAIYFKMAADKGDRDGLFNLGLSYDNGWVAEEGRSKVRHEQRWVEKWTHWRTDRQTDRQTN